MSSTTGKPRSQDALLVASLLHLMSHYTAHDEREQALRASLASVIERHLCALARLPDSIRCCAPPASSCANAGRGWWTKECRGR